MYQPSLRFGSLAGQAFDSILTLDMQIFGQTFTSFGPESQMIITQGVANFLNSGVAASQIVLTVRDQIAGVSHLPAFPAYVVKSSSVDRMITKAASAVHIARNMLMSQI